MEDVRDGRRPLRCLDALQLKLIAMALMLCDHIHYVFLQDKGFEWMTWIGRFAFPIFAFQIVEGFAHTHSFKRYWGRMLLFALSAVFCYRRDCTERGCLSRGSSVSCVSDIRSVYES